MTQKQYLCVFLISVFPPFSRSGFGSPNPIDVENVFKLKANDLGETLGANKLARLQHISSEFSAGTEKIRSVRQITLTKKSIKIMARNGYNNGKVIFLNHLMFHLQMDPTESF